MMVFGSRHIEEKTKEIVQYITTTAKEIFESCFDHNRIVKLLIEFGEFETALSDHFDNSGDDQIREKLRAAGKLTGDAFRKSVKKDIGLINSTREFLKIFHEIEKLSLPETLIAKVPEGYAYYGLYPEMYLQAAEQFYKDYQPKNTVIIGIRSIGTSLSSVIWSALDLYGTTTYSFTVRPFGNPFDRQIKFQNTDQTYINNNKNAYFLIVDEGPGLSGTSFSSVADALINTGIPRNKIILFPSRMTTGDDFNSDKAKNIWKSTDKRFVSFDDYWLNSGKFNEVTGNYKCEEISAGKWREIFLKDEKNFPPIFEQFERRKFVLKDRDNEIKYFVKFSGLGKYGEWVFKNALKFAEAGFSPEVYKLDQGFIFYRYIKNNNQFDINKLIGFVKEYLLYIEKNFPDEPSYTYDEMKEMIYINTKNFFDNTIINKIMNLKFDHSIFSSAVKNDGRMFPYEWLYNEQYMKTDNAEHYFDHLFPGSQDVTWDIAAFFTEFNLDANYRKDFIEMFSSVSKDKYIAKKLKFIMLEYLAFRIGYCSFAAQNCLSQIEKDKFNIMVGKYSRDLVRETQALI